MRHLISLALVLAFTLALSAPVAAGNGPVISLANGPLSQGGAAVYNVNGGNGNIYLIWVEQSSYDGSGTLIQKQYTPVEWDDPKAKIGHSRDLMTIPVGTATVTAYVWRFPSSEAPISSVISNPVAP